MQRRGKLVAFALAAALVSRSASAAENEAPAPFELGTFGGVLFPSRSHELLERGPYQPYARVAPELGTRFSFFPLPEVGLELEGAVMASETLRGDAAGFWAGRAQAALRLPFHPWTLFGVFGLGALGAASNELGSDADPALHVGLGGGFALDDFVGLRLDLRDTLTQKQAASSGVQTHHFEVLVGLSFGLHPSAKARRAQEAELGTSALEAAGERERRSDDATTLRLSGGGLWTGGNSQTLMLASSGRFRLRRGPNQLGASVAANYGEATAEGSEERRINVENVQGRLRYGRFVAERLSLFLAKSVLRDRLQHLALRLNLAPGVAYHLLSGPNHQLWGELGYDLQHDFRRSEAVDRALAEGQVLTRTKVVHSARLFAGYENDLSDALAVELGVEYLQSLTEGRRARVAWNAGLTSRVAGNFSVATAFVLRYDHAPLPAVQRTDYTSAVSLVYQLL